MWTALSIVGMYLMSQPDVGGAETPGWVFLTSLIPSWWDDEHRYWQSAGAILFVLAVGRSRGWQRFFNLDVVQYFGKISYPLYLMHGPVLHTVGYAIQRWAWGLTGVEGSAYAWGFALAAVFIVPVVIWVSDVFWRAVDAPVVRLAKWLEATCSISE
jgi:peptidoglycan/LPS O-acetylase OafA/YrhL